MQNLQTDEDSGISTLVFSILCTSSIMVSLDESMPQKVYNEFLVIASVRSESSPFEHKISYINHLGFTTWSANDEDIHFHGTSSRNSTC